MTQQEIQYKKMTGDPVKPLVVRLAIPTIITMLVTSLYNMADTAFVSHLGKSASGAVGVVFSLMAVIQAVGFTLGMGAGSIISRALGVKDSDKANLFASVAFFSSIVFGILLAVFGSVFISSLMLLLGATETALPYAEAYASYILYGAPIMASSFVMNNILRSEGKARLAMIGITTGGILNIGLDPLFIYTFDIGIAGAAIATLISQAISFTIMLIFFLSGKTVVKIGFSRVIRREIPSVLFEIVRTGAPSFCRQGFASVSTILLNNQAGTYGGDAALSAMSIVTKIFMMIFCVGLGIGQGYQPVVGYNYSAKNWSRVREAYLFTYAIGTAVMLVLGVVAFILAPVVLPLFIDDDEVISIGIRALRYQAIAMPFLSTNVMCNMTYQSIGKNFNAVMLSCCRQGLFFIPLVLILPSVFGLTGVEMVQAAADLCTFAVSVPFVFRFCSFINRKAAE